MHSWLANEVNVSKWVAVIHSENKIADSFLKQKMHMAQAVNEYLCLSAVFSTPANQC